MNLMCNPRIVLWPGGTTTLARVEVDGRIAAMGLASQRLLDLLMACRTPLSSAEISAYLGFNSDLSIEILRDKGLLVTPDSARELQDWEGFRIRDLDADMSPNSSDLEIDDRSGVDFPVRVIDRPLSNGCFRSLSNWFSRQSFSLTDVDSERTSFSRHWVYALNPTDPAFLRIPMFSWLDAVCRLCATESRLWLAEAKAYLTPFGDVPTFHRDSERGPTVTAVLFCHTSWQPDWAGELIIADAAGEPRVAILPLPGRLVVFSGDLPHRAGAPNQIAHGPRQSLVFRYEVLQ